MEQLGKDVSEVILLESLNAQRIDKLSEGMTDLRETLRDSIAQLATSVATGAQAMAGFRELHAREVTFIYQSLNEVKEVLDELKTFASAGKEKINAVEKDIAVARGSVKGAVMTWSGCVALAAFVTDKVIEILGRR